jgi:hypothetical protein
MKYRPHRQPCRKSGNGHIKLKARFLAALLIAGVLGNPLARAADKYLLLNYAPDGFTTRVSSATIIHYVADKFGAANRTSSLKAGVACIYFPGARWTDIPRELALLQKDLAMARESQIPILVQVDTETYLPASLLNWYDPNLPGYDPAKTADVEWHGWDRSTAIKLCWRNWGSPFRIGPAPNFLSARFQAYEKGIYYAFVPVVLEWYNNLPAEKKWLFVGWKCGWESAYNGNYRFFSNGNAYYGSTINPAWSNHYEPLGYNAAKTSGIRTSGTLTENDYARLVGMHLTYLAKLAIDAGVPKSKISVHGTYYHTVQEDEESLTNPFSNPGSSFYPSSSVCWASNTALFREAVHTAEAKYGATGYGYGEFNLFTSDYKAWLSWFKARLHDDPDCLYQALYNYDSMYGRPDVERALLDAMAQCPAAAQ